MGVYNRLILTLWLQTFMVYQVSFVFCGQRGIVQAWIIVNSYGGKFLFRIAWIVPIQTQVSFQLNKHSSALLR